MSECLEHLLGLDVLSQKQLLNDRYHEGALKASDNTTDAKETSEEVFWIGNCRTPAEVGVCTLNPWGVTISLQY